MRKLYILIASFIFCSCTPKVIALKGTYPDKPFELSVDKSKDAVWDNIIDFFATKGLSIKLIDRSSGLIVSEKTALVWSYENSKGQLEKPSAWVVIPKLIDPRNPKAIGESKCCRGLEYPGKRDKWKSLNKC